MFRKKFIDKLREKYQFGGPRSGLRNPLLTLQGRSISTDAGQRFGAGAKLSAPLIEAINHGNYATGTRFETDFAGTNAGPISISDKIKAYNASIGLRGYHNRYLNRDNSLSLHSDIGAGIGTGDETLDNEMNPFVDANLSLLKSGRTRKGTNISGGPTLSYGTEGSPNQGLNLGLKGNYGRLSGDVSYDFTNKTPRAGLSLNFQDGGMYDQMQQYKKGGDKDKKAVDNENLVDDYTNTYYGDGFNNHVSEKEIKEHLSKLNVTENDTMLHMPHYLDGGSGMLMQVYDARRDLLNKSGMFRWDKQDYSNPKYLSEFEKYRKNDSETLKDLPISTSNNEEFKFFKIPKTHNVKETGGMYDQMRQYEGGGPKYNLTGDYNTASVSGTEMVDESGNILPMSPAYLQDPKYGSSVDLQGNPILNESGMPTWYGPSKINTGMLAGNSYSSINDPSFNNTTPFNRESQSKFGLAYPDMKKTGGTKLPGGIMQPIPGSDAVVFKGATHDQGGIGVDEKTEVEGGGFAPDGTPLEGETMDKVNMNKEGLKDYFFSDHLKKGGRSYAEMHKEILANGGDQEEINTLARMQEKAAGRNPKQVANLGGVMKYQSGGKIKGLEQLKELEEFEASLEPTQENMRKYPHLFEIDPEATKKGGGRVVIKRKEKSTAPITAPIENIQVPIPSKIGGTGGGKEAILDELQELYPMVNREKLINWHNKQIKKNSKPKENIPKENTTPTVEYTSPFTTKEEEKAFQDWANANNYNTKGYGWGKASQDAYDKGYGDYIKSIEAASEALNNADTEKVVKEVIDNESDVVVDKKRGRLEGLEADQVIYDNLQGMLDNGRTLTPEQQADYDRVFLSLGDDRMTTLQRRAEEERIASEKKQFDDANKKLAKKGDVPALAYVAGAAQLAPAVYSMFHKQPAAEQSVYTPGFTSPIIAEQGKASELERVNYNAERSANAADMRGINKFIETSGGGPANIINKMSAYARKQAGDMKITAAETRANADIANREAQMNQQMDISNMQRAQQASMTNAQLSRAETARMDQIGQLNAQARQKLKDDQEAMKYQGWGLAAQGIAGLAGDVMQYQGQERLARNIGTEGRYERDLLRNLVRKQNPEWNDDQINDFITQYNTTT